jgi:hypothetical protein
MSNTARIDDLTVVLDTPTPKPPKRARPSDTMRLRNTQTEAGRVRLETTRTLSPMGKPIASPGSYGGHISHS